MKLFLTLVLGIIILFYTTPLAHADYVLPYPGVMPGNKLYKVYSFIDTLKSYYSFGDIAQFKYNLSQSDKYLVEAKTLFEYGQYLLGDHALRFSDLYFKKVYPDLLSAKNHNKNTKDLQTILDQARSKHIQVLEKLREELPKTFVWQDEKKQPIQLSLEKDIKNSIQVRTGK